MFTSRLVHPSAMISTEKSACVANLPHSHKHTRARFLLLAVVMVLLLYCDWFWCCYDAINTAAAYSLVLSHHLQRKNERKKERHKKNRKQRTSGEFPNKYFLVGKYGLSRKDVRICRACPSKWARSKYVYNIPGG